MSNVLIKDKEKGVLLSSATQIEIVELLRKGKTYTEIDNILDVPKGSSQYTINYVKRCKHEG